jgi:hypothetical protein
VGDFEPPKESNFDPGWSLLKRPVTGYEQLGGYSVHVRLRRITYDSDKKLRNETAIITVTEKRGLQPVTIQE